jgi:hypothetical protein
MPSAFEERAGEQIFAVLLPSKRPKIEFSCSLPRMIRRFMAEFVFRSFERCLQMEKDSAARIPPQQSMHIKN